MYEIEYCTSVGFILRNGVVDKKKRKAERIFFYIYLWLSFLFPCGIHLFPIASSPSLLMSLFVTSPSTPPASLSLSVSCPRGLSSPVFLQEFRAQGQGESSSAKCL